MKIMKNFTEGIDKIYSDLDGLNEAQFTPDFMLGRVHRTLKHLVHNIDPEGEDPLGSTFGVIKDLINDIETKTQGQGNTPPADPGGVGRSWSFNDTDEPVGPVA